MLSAQFARFGNKASGIIISRRDYLVLVLIALFSLAVGAGIANATSNNSSSNKYSYSELSVESSRPFSVSSLVNSLRGDFDRRERIFETMKSYTDSIRAEVKGGQTELRVNDQPVDVPDNGTVHKNIKTENGNVEIHIESNNTQSANNKSGNRSNRSSSIHIDSNSSSHSEIDIEKETEIR